LSIAIWLFYAICTLLFGKSFEMNSPFCGKDVQDLLINFLLDEKKIGSKWQKEGVMAKIVFASY
jgi:hypothetical protein